ncbi:hypothetical protein [Polymorphobacter fuscus]|uniref:Uncharacterized protein n=1 Tax=Sandarakinorhabdus fusca TaxID=1439888 RepID=A0A7C9KXY4_9SPHN|nr:hypothetical protein [Polymorphobacter fuscus]KAB7644405.1 hypothetical protein F9290_13800 [Polymorphobacter fuscus]MQT18325.1 hypothetical protein [Polymorphobacter fuscus]NJC08224.1 hypothetical protein [Polymorphobacter fuscus]
MAGPFTVENLSPHRIVPADAEDQLAAIDAVSGKKMKGPLSNSETDFATMVIEHLKSAGVHQQERADRIEFTSLTPFAGRGYIGAEGRFMEGETERRAAIFIGPEFGTLSRVDFTAAAREAAESRFDVLIAVSFAFDAHASELTRLGPLSILKAKMNPDLHMAGELKNTGKGNLFVVFGEPDIDILEEADGRIAVRVNGVDIYDPNTGEVRSNDVKGIAAWFIDTAYNEESFFVRHAYFLGANEPYKQLKTALKAEIDEEAWATLNRATSRPFDRPESGRIAVKVINHFGDELMKVFGVYAMFNFLVSGDDEAWNGEPYAYERSRVFEYTEDAIVGRFNELREDRLSDFAHCPQCLLLKAGGRRTPALVKSPQFESEIAKLS